MHTVHDTRVVYFNTIPQTVVLHLVLELLHYMHGNQATLRVLIGN